MQSLEDGDWNYCQPFLYFQGINKNTITISMPTGSVDGRPEYPAQLEPNPVKTERILGLIAMPCFVTVLEAPFLLPQAAHALGEAASLASGTPRPPPPAGLLLAEAQLLAVAGQGCLLGGPAHHPELLLQGPGQLQKVHLLVHTEVKALKTARPIGQAG